MFHFSLYVCCLWLSVARIFKQLKSKRLRWFGVTIWSQYSIFYSWEAISVVKNLSLLFATSIQILLNFEECPVSISPPNTDHKALPFMISRQILMEAKDISCIFRFFPTDWKYFSSTIRNITRDKLKISDSFSFCFKLRTVGYNVSDFTFFNLCKWKS